LEEEIWIEQGKRLNRDEKYFPKSEGEEFIC